MNIIINILIILLFISGIIFFVINQKNNLKEWLLYIVIEAEKSLGSKTGKLKLRQAYDEFIFAFPVISKLIPFKVFSDMVDSALIEMKIILKENKRVKEYIEGDGL